MLVSCPPLLHIPIQALVMDDIKNNNNCSGATFFKNFTQFLRCPRGIGFTLQQAGVVSHLPDRWKEVKKTKQNKYIIIEKHKT